MTSRIVAVAIDCFDPNALAEFWCAALGYHVTRRFTEGVEYVEIGDGESVSLVFQRVPEGKIVKNRLHLDVAPREGSQADEVRRLLGLGAREVSTAPDFPWVILADPEGNEFCVLLPR